MKILMVCTGNICRSPAAEGVMRSKIKAAGLDKSWQVDSAGTHDYHTGAAPDKRGQQVAKQRGYDLSAQQARQLTAEDFERFDVILFMDAANQRAIADRFPQQAQNHKDKLALLRDYDSTATAGAEVPDPYYGDRQDLTSHWI